MQKLMLVGQNNQGKTPTQPLPTLQCQTVWVKNSQQLAVIFEVNDSPDKDFLPKFFQNRADEIPALRQDFLWDAHCYELFLAFSVEKHSPYIEINFSPTGAFNLYQFAGYRTPSQLPPPHLMLTKAERATLLNFYSVNQDRQALFWQASTAIQQAVKAKLENERVLPEHSHRLVMLVDVTVLKEKLNGGSVNKIWLNPCGVFKGSEEITYFAHHHTNPPDFHDKQAWIEVAER